jgi:flagellar hook-basal body complex protein FliE
MNPLQTIAGGTFSIEKSNRVAFDASLTATPTEQASNLGGASFMEVIGAAVEKVSELQGESRRLSKHFQMEEGDVGLEETMIAMQKASLGVQAYNDIMNMPV